MKYHLLNNTSVDDLRASLSCAEHNEHLPDMLDRMQASLIDERKTGERKGVITLLERYIKRAEKLGTTAVVPEVLPAVAEQDEYADRVVMLHTAAEQHASASVLCAAMAGAVLVMKKNSCKHGEFTKWIRTITLPDGRQLHERTGRRYMKLAEEMAERIKAMPKPKRVTLLGDGKTDTGVRFDSAKSIVSLLASIDPTQADDLRRQAIAEAVREVASEDTLTQLYFDWGIVKPTKKTGGDVELQAWLKEHHPKLAGTKRAKLPAKIREEFEAYLEARKPTDEEIIEAERDSAKEYWLRVRTDLAEFGTKGNPTWGLLDDQHLLETMVVMNTLAQRIKRALNERGAR